MNFEPSLAPHMYVFDKKNEGMNHIPLFDYHSYFFYFFRELLTYPAIPWEKILKLMLRKLCRDYVFQ